MKAIYGIGQIKLRKPSSITVGVFDGLHLAHQHIIKKVVSLAKSNKFLSVVITFFPHPDSIIKSKMHSPLLISLKHRLNLISSFGVDICVVVKFDSYLKEMEAEDFILKFLIGNYRMKNLVVSENFIFGKGKGGNKKLIEKLAKKYHFKVYFQKTIKINNKVVSSTLIRSLINQGNLEYASKLLGRRFEVIGTVVGGDRRGKKIGFPTANIDPHHEVIPPKGVYLIKAYLGRKTLLGLANIGFRPTFKEEENEIIELHLLNFNKDIYGKDMRVVFLKKIREEIKFTKKSILIQQIKEDIQLAKSFFSI